MKYKITVSLELILLKNIKLAKTRAVQHYELNFSQALACHLNAQIY